MRNIGSLPDGEQAARFLGFLERLEISAETRRSGDEWQIWTHHEKTTAAAREELATFIAEPTHPRYLEIKPAKVAKDGAAQQQLTRRPRTARREWRADGGNQLSLALIIISAGVMLLRGLGDSDLPLKMALNIVPFDPQTRLITNSVWGAVLDGQVWRIISPIFLHSGWLHLSMNGLGTYYLGSMIEMRIGLARFLGLTLLIGAVSNIAQSFSSNSFGGLSGVVYGYVGYCWMKTRYAPSLGYWLPPEVIAMALGWAVLCLFSDRVANTAHFTGLAVGMLVSAIPELLRQRR
ncbi:MAG: rhomboid family intramembrane serine protease [Planctomycetota bacterium]